MLLQGVLRRRRPFLVARPSAWASLFSPQRCNFSTVVAVEPDRNVHEATSSLQSVPVSTSSVNAGRLSTPRIAGETPPAACSNAGPSDRRVHVSTLTRANLSPRQRHHLAELEGLLWRRVTQARGAALTPPLQVDKQQPEKTPLVCADGCADEKSPLSLGELFVMSRAVTSPTLATALAHTPHAPPSSRADTRVAHAPHPCPDCQRRGREEVFTGINHALHKHVNPHGATLRGILKGCAEQNALGAVAASGCAYTDITDVLVVAARVGQHYPRDATRTAEHATAKLRDDAAEGVPLPHVVAADIFPCPECWRHLCHVARVRQSAALSPLRLLVCASSPASTLPLIALAQQRMRAAEEPMEVCIVTC